jgi:hypothetical protein
MHNVHNGHDQKQPPLNGYQNLYSRASWQAFSSQPINQNICNTETPIVGFISLIRVIRDIATNA